MSAAVNGLRMGNTSYFRPYAISSIWIRPEKSSFFRKLSYEPVQLTTGPLSFSDPVLSKDGKKLFVMGQQTRGELVRYDAKSRQFLPFLAGISASEADFSRDGQWVTYVTFPENTLWRSKADGSERLQLTYPPMEAELPALVARRNPNRFYRLAARQGSQDLSDFSRRR